MLFARFLPIIGTLAIAGSLAGKKKIATSAGTLSTTNGMFVFLLILIVLIIGALSFFPALALGPLAEFFSNVDICGNERHGDKRNKISAGKNNGRLKEKKDEICFTYRAWQVWQTHCNEA